MGRSRAPPGRGGVGDRDGDLPDSRGLEARTPGRKAAIPDPDPSPEGRVRWTERWLVGEHGEVRAEARRQTDLLEPLGGKERRSGPMSTVVHAGSGEWQQGDQGDEADGEHGKRGENLRKRQSLLLRKERTHAS